jgi:hypothetical protein
MNSRKQKPKELNMPNWVSSTLYVRGPQKSLDKFREQALGEEDAIDLNNFIPMPEEIRGISSHPVPVEEHEYEEALKKHEENKSDKRLVSSRPVTQKMLDEMIEKYGATNWYDWSLENYGTKWGLCDVEDISCRKGELMYDFSTAWSPAEKAWLKISSMFPDLKFITTLDEESNSFGGYQIFEKGKMVEKLIENYMSDEVVENINYLVDMSVEEAIRDMEMLKDECGHSKAFMDALKKKIAGEKLEYARYELEDLWEEVR